MNIQTLNDDTLPDARIVLSQAFAFGKRDSGDSSKADDEKSTSYGIYDEAGLQAALEINHYTIYMGNQVQMKMGGIGGVACLPASRGKGYAGEILKNALKMMKERGEHASFLFPFSWDFYRKYGWEWTGLQRTYSIPTKILKSSAETEYVRAVTSDDWKEIASVYEVFSKRYRGMIVRNEESWEDKLKHEDKQFTFAYVYVRDSKIEGYLILRGGKQEEARLNEFISLTARSQQGLLGLLRRHDMQIDKFVWATPEDDSLWSQTYHWDIETKLEPAASARVVDVAGALSAWKPISEFNGKFRMEVQDEYAEWNAGKWNVEIENSHVHVTRTDESADISLDIQALSQVYFGSPNPDQLKAAERIRVINETSYQAFRKLFTGPTMWINDHF